MSISCDYEPARVYNKSTVRAAKDHRCCECHGIIRKGEGHELVKGCWDDSWSTFRTCADCVHLRCETAKIYSDSGCGWLHGGMMEEISNLGDNAQHDPQAARLVGMFNAIAAARKSNSAELPLDPELQALADTVLKEEEV